MQSQSNFRANNSHNPDPDLQKVLNRLYLTMEKDTLVRQTTNKLRKSLQVNRVVLYYFYRQWDGQVTFESLSADKYSILGSTGPDECFNDEYAALYLARRVRAIADIETEPIADCHRDCLRNLQVRANLAVPVLNANGLWGLLIAHHVQSPREWSSADIELMQTEAETLATADCIRES